MTALQIDVWSDYVCPWCYLLSLDLNRLEQVYPVTIQWHTYELYAEQSPLLETYKQKITEKRFNFINTAKQQYGITINPGPVGIPTRNIHIVAKYAEEENRGEQYRNAVFNAYWQHAKDIHSEHFLEELINLIGTDDLTLNDILVNPVYQARVATDIGLASMYNIKHVPTLLFNGKHLIIGAQPYHEIVNIVTQLLNCEDDQ